MQRVAITIIFGFFMFGLYAQVSTNLRIKTILIKTDTTALDTLPISDLKILSPTDLDSTKYKID